MTRPVNPSWYALAIGTALLLWVAALTTRELLSAGAARGLLISAPMILEAVTVAGGLYLLARGTVHRIGKSTHCRRCDYEQAESHRLVSTCPECDAPWRWYGGAVRGRPIRTAWMFSLGLILTLLGTGAFVVRAGAPHRVINAMPDTVLLYRLRVLPGYALDREWSEVATRTLSAQQENQLLDAILDKRLRDGYLWRADADWAAKTALKKTTPVPLANRYFQEMFEPTIEVPPRIQQRFEARISGPQRPSGRSNARLFAYITAYEGDSKTPFWKSARSIAADTISAADEGMTLRMRLPDDGQPRLTTRINFVVWLAYHRGFETRIIWGDDGEPIFPVSTLWKSRLDFDRTASVVE